MKITGEGKRLRIYVNETDRIDGATLHEALVRKAHELGLAGASVFHGVSGYGAGSRIHTTKVLRLADDLPVVIEIIDSDEKIRVALPALQQLVATAGVGSLITLETTEIVA